MLLNVIFHICSLRKSLYVITGKQAKFLVRSHLDDLSCSSLKLCSSEETLLKAASMCNFLMALPTPYQTAVTLGIQQTKLICSIEINPTPGRSSSGLRGLRIQMFQIKWIPVRNGVFCIEGILSVLPVEESLHLLHLTLNLESSTS